jgi:muramoyltetrapeptide carboxypeptidase
MREAGLVTFHGPMAASNFADPASPPWTWDMTLRMLTSTEPLGWLSSEAPLERQPVTLIEGHGRRVSGPLVGGNLAHVQVTIGTRFEIDTRGKIVFLEDLGERPYKVDRMLTHLLSAGKLADAAGIALGIFDDCAEPGVDPEGALHPPSLIEVFRERLGGLGIPVLYGLPISHTPINATLPMGLQATLDPERGDVHLDESAVTA